jgi:hypothetical protein
MSETTPTVQFWLAELDRYGNPTLVDGMHSEREGAERAFYLYGRLGYVGERRFAVARVELSSPTGSRDGVNEELLSVVADTLAKYEGKAMP